MSRTREEWDKRDQAELKRRQDQLARPEYKGYLLVLCIVIVLRSEEHTSELSHPTTSRMPSSA